MNNRIAKLREGLFYNIPEICSERAVIFTDSMKKSEGEPIVKRRAKALYEILDKMTIYIRPGELIVGNQASKRQRRSCFSRILGRLDYR